MKEIIIEFRGSRDNNCGFASASKSPIYYLARKSQFHGYVTGNQVTVWQNKLNVRLFDRNISRLGSWYLTLRKVYLQKCMPYPSTISHAYTYQDYCWLETGR
ncbi:hypothetical protein OCU04_005514 [Sclerotinia nivalis]|uniref:Uncharacterized protein n=1 Tax=Sclerotinia nivalis TaxID=352851 RepID=A0A9X0DKL5_9HELO|nr:hypothetical protein OCU04_005514 [Sclerotinia nivalis]